MARNWNCNSNAGLTHGLANGPRRAFSRSAACSRGALPVYVEPSTPTLAALLAKFNSKVLLPLHLNEEQKKLVFRQENKAKLEAEPVEITLGDVTLPLEHLDRNTLPDRFRSIRDIVRQSKTPEDFENIVKLLEGAQNAGLKVRPEWQELIVRRLNAAGMHHLVLKALQRSKATGLRLTNHGVVMQVVRGLHDKAALADWGEEEASKALRIAKQVTELMEEDEHNGGRVNGIYATKHDHRRVPAVVALPTELAAVLAQRHQGHLTEVKTLATRLLLALTQTDFSLQLDDLAKRLGWQPTKAGHYDNMKTAFSTTTSLLELIIVWNALKTSQAVLGADMPMAKEARALEARVEQVLNQGMTVLPKLITPSERIQSSKIYAYLQDAVERCKQE